MSAFFLFKTVFYVFLPSTGSNRFELAFCNFFWSQSSFFGFWKVLGLDWSSVHQKIQTRLDLTALIKSALSTAYHPQTDGTTERVNQEIEAYLSIYCASHPEEWPSALHTLEFTHNNQRHADRQHTPFELMFGESPIAVPLSFENTKYPTMEERMRT